MDDSPTRATLSDLGQPTQKALTLACLNLTHTGPSLVPTRRRRQSSGRSPRNTRCLPATWYKDQSRQDMRGQTSHIAIHHCNILQFAFPVGLSTFSLAVDVDNRTTKRYKFPPPSCVASRLFYRQRIRTSLSLVGTSRETTRRPRGTILITTRASCCRIHTSSSLRIPRIDRRQDVHRLRLPLPPLRPPGRADDPGLPQDKEPGRIMPCRHHYQIRGFQHILPRPSTVCFQPRFTERMR